MMVGRGKHPLDFGARAGEWFFAKHMFAGGQGAHRPLAMQPVVQTVDNGVPDPGYGT